MIKYRVTWGLDGDVIREVEVSRETPKFVVLVGERWGEKKESRYAKRGRYDNFFDTWEEAHQFLLDRATIRFRSAQVVLERAQENLKRIEAMKP